MNQFLWPCEGRISQHFVGNYAKYAPKSLVGHMGTDVSALVGTSVIAGWDGVVSQVGSDPDGWGYYLELWYPYLGYKALFAHLRELPDLQVNQPVRRGQVVAFSGNTGRSTGPHLHYSLRKVDLHGRWITTILNLRGYIDPVIEHAWINQRLEAAEKPHSIFLPFVDNRPTTSAPPPHQKIAVVGKGLHDLAAGSSGLWRTVSMSLTSESLDGWVRQLSTAFIPNLIIRLNWAYHPEGTIPLAAQWPEYIEKCFLWVSALQPFCRRWIIGNETNLPLEWPQGKPIVAESYVELFNLVQQRILAVQPGAEVMLAPVSPGVIGWQDYWRTLVTESNPQSYALHTYSHNYSKEAIWSGPAWHTYREALDIVPSEHRQKPVYITEANGGPWVDYQVGWLRTVMDDLAWWNSQLNTQDIQAIMFYAADDRGDGYGMLQYPRAIREYDALPDTVPLVGKER